MYSQLASFCLDQMAPVTRDGHIWPMKNKLKQCVSFYLNCSCPWDRTIVVSLVTRSLAGESSALRLIDRVTHQEALTSSCGLR